MDQLPPDSHWATASHSEAVAAEALPAASSGAATAAPATPASEMTRTALDGRRCLPLPEHSMVRSPHRRLRGELSGSGRLSCPAVRNWAHGSTPSRPGRCPGAALTLGPPLLPTALDATTVPHGRWQDSALRPWGPAVASGHDRKQSIRGISKTIRAFETHLSLSPNRTL